MQFSDDINKQLFGLVGKINKLNRYIIRKLVAAKVARMPH